jgi:hypothetical protein
LIEAGLSSRREIAENPECILRTALVGVNPVLPCDRGRPDRSEWRRTLDTPVHLLGRDLDLTIWQVRVVAVKFITHKTWALGCAWRSPQLLYLRAQRVE